VEILGNLENKIKRLVTVVKDLRSDNERLCEENKALGDEINKLHQTLSQKNKDFQSWDQEKACTKKIIDELIIDIDSLIETGSR
jgi:regulator of replication initiation timing